MHANASASGSRVLLASAVSVPVYRYVHLSQCFINIVARHGSHARAILKVGYHKAHGLVSSKLAELI